MWIKIEFNPDLALRNYQECISGNRKREECIPQEMEVGGIYPFFKKEQRLYWLYGAIPLIETRGNEKLSRPKASIQILEATHFLENGSICTRGFYKVLEIFHDESIQFECFDRVGSRDF